MLLKNDMVLAHSLQRKVEERVEKRESGPEVDTTQEAIGANTAATVCVASVACGCELMSSCDFCLMTLGLLTMTVGGNC